MTITLPVHNRNDSPVTKYSDDEQIYILIANNKVESVKQLIKEKPKLLSKKDQSGNTLFHIAIMNNRTEILITLLDMTENYEEFHIENSDKLTPLILAVQNRNTEQVEQIVKKYPPTSLDENKAFTLAIKLDCMDVFNALLKHRHYFAQNGSFRYPDKKPIFHLIDNGNHHGFELCLKYFHLNDRVAYDIFWHICKTGNTEFLKYLLNTIPESLKSGMAYWRIDKLFYNANTECKTLLMEHLHRQLPSRQVVFNRRAANEEALRPSQPKDESIYCPKHSEFIKK